MSGDAGAVAVIVAILLPVVLLGFGALVLDIGSLYAEKRQLQNGADAAAFAIAQDCAKGNCGTPSATAAQLANENANDGAANVEDICGNAAGLIACIDPPTVPAGAGYVRVKTQTGDSAGPGLMPPLLGRVLDPSYDGQTVHASATVVWGEPGALSAVFPLTFSACDYTAQTAGGTIFATTPYAASAEKVIYFHSNPEAAPCASTPAASGLDLPGGFGWVSVAGCTSSSTLGSTLPVDTGNSVPQDCTVGNGQTAAFLLDQYVGQIIQLPVFGAMSGTGTGGTYTITTYASFYLTGYYFDQQHQHASIVSGNVPCGQPDSCLSGYFVQSTADPEAADTVGGGTGGVTVFQLLD